MKLTKDLAASSFGGPANYQVVVQGSVSEEWSTRLGGMVITQSNRESGELQTILQGTLHDQSALRGLLETLYALHLPILEVKKVDNSFGENAAKGQAVKRTL